MSDDNPHVKIRRAAAGDAAALGRLGALLVRTHHDFDPRRFIAPSPRTEQGYGSFLGGQIEQRETVILVAERDEAVVGYCYAGVEGFDYMALRGPAGVLQDIVVDPAHRNQGIGGLLLQQIITEMEGRGVRQLVLSTAEKNEAAQRLFTRAGFRRTMIEMTRDLP